MKSWKHGLATAAAAAALTTVVPASAVDEAPGLTSLNYVIERKGDDVGRHRVIYAERPGGDLDIEIEADIRVKLAFITVFRMEHDSQETWRAGDLVGMITRTRSGRDQHEVELTAAGDHYLVETGAGLSTAPSDVVPSSFTKLDFWIDEGTKDFQLLDTLSGLQRPSRLIFDGRRQLTIDGQAIDVRYYRVINLDRDELSHEFWIDDAGFLIKTHLITKTGESLHYTYTQA